MVFERNPEFVASSDGFCFLAEEPLHSGELLSLCIGQRPQQLCFIRLPSESPILDLRTGAIGSGDSGSHQKGAAIGRPYQGSWGAILACSEAGTALCIAKMSSAGAAESMQIESRCPGCSDTMICCYGSRNWHLPSRHDR
jgi:hypothetical protein